jgi:release factor glutamine methyltransferase
VSVARADAALVAEVVDLGVAPHEARWLVEEFAPGADESFRSSVIGAARRRLAGEPLQYVIGHWPFRTLDLDLDTRVLIPRPETEELVDLALSALAAGEVVAPLVIDLGCGSGAIGLSVLAELATRGVAATLVAIDRSEGALAVARRNALKHRIMAASFVRSNWFSDLDVSLEGHVDLIVANPPYVAAGEYDSLAEELHHEPIGALVADDADGVGGFADVAHIIEGAARWLADGATLIIEHGASQGAPARAAAERAGFVGVATERDMAGHDRFLVARWRP